MKARLISLLAAALLVACGGATTSSVDPSQHTQQKTARPSIKQDNDSYASAVQSLYIAYFCCGAPKIDQLKKEVRAEN